MIYIITNPNAGRKSTMMRAMKSVTWAVTLLLAGTLMGSASATEPSVPPKPINVLLIGNSQCPTIVRYELLETLAASDKGQRPIKVAGCIKGGASLRSHWEAGTGGATARGMIASGSWDYVVLQDIYNALTERSPIGLAAPDEIPADIAKTLQETAWAQHQETVASLKVASLKK